MAKNFVLSDSDLNGFKKSEAGASKGKLPVNSLCSSLSKNIEQYICFFTNIWETLRHRG